MDSPTSSPGIIPKKTLKIWKVFNDLRPEGGEILKSAKLAHVHEKEGIVVTMEDETYHFLRDDKHAARTTRVRELCGVRVKEFILGPNCLALTEDGRLYVWSRFPESVCFTPVVVTGSLKGEEVVQMASSEGRHLALFIKRTMTMQI